MQLLQVRERQGSSVAGGRIYTQRRPAWQGIDQSHQWEAGSALLARLLSM